MLLLNVEQLHRNPVSLSPVIGVLLDSMSVNAIDRGLHPIRNDIDLYASDSLIDAPKSTTCQRSNLNYGLRLCRCSIYRTEIFLKPLLVQSVRFLALFLCLFCLAVPRRWLHGTMWWPIARISVCQLRLQFLHDFKIWMRKGDLDAFPPTISFWPSQNGLQDVSAKTSNDGISVECNWIKTHWTKYILD